MEWISVKDRLPDNANNGVHDSFPVMVKIDRPTSNSSLWDIKITAWINNGFQGYPAGSTNVTHWMPLELPFNL